MGNSANFGSPNSTRTMRKLALLFVVLACTLFSSAQSNPSRGCEECIFFRSGTEAIQPNYEEEFYSASVTEAQCLAGSAWFLVQFISIPSDVEWMMIESLGVKRLGYIPNNTYILSLPLGFEFKALNDFGVRAVMTLAPHHKIHPQLSERPFPEWAMSDERVMVVIEYFENILPVHVLGELQTMRVPVIEVGAYGSSITVAIDPNRIDELAQMKWVLSLELPSPPPVHDDTEARSLHRSNMLDASVATGRHYDGTGVSGAIGDDGIIGPHIDYQGRLDQSNAGASTGNHGDMTSGIMMGAGNIDPRIKGHASGLFLHYYSISNYEHITDAPNLHNNFGVMVTSTSYSQGCNAGYNTSARDGDQMLRQNPSLIHVFSAGNAGSDNCGYGAGAGWGNVTGGYKQGKNVIACGNLNNIDALENSSSRGPAADGRIKPDVCANGFDQLSTDGPNTYQVGGGTSAASPSVAGVVAQLYQAYRELNGGADPESALIKACILNTSEDLGNPGPDYRYGYGRINGFKSVRTLEMNRYLSGTISNGGNNVHNLSVPAGISQLRVMCYWLDYEGSTVASKALVNNLDFSVVDPSINTFNPWVLNPAPNAGTLNNPAVRAIDTLNNVEQVTIDNPTLGSYQLLVSGTSVPQGPQKYWIVYEFVTDEITVTYPNGGEGFVPGETELIRWEANGTSGNFTLQYSLNNGATWNNISTTVNGSLRHRAWTVPAALSGQVRVRVLRGVQSDMSDENFSIIGVPQNVVIDEVCPTFTRLAWDAVPGATGYEVYRLGMKYMDSVGFTTSTNFDVLGVKPSDTEWLSVRAYGPGNAKGLRAIAIEKGPAPACPTPNDAALSQVLSPAAGLLPDCMGADSVSVVIELENSATNSLTNIPVSYSLNGGPAVTETYPGTLAPSEKDTFTFSAKVDLSTVGQHDLVVWTAYPGDTDSDNDTASVTVNVIAGTLIASLPYTQTFESFTNCNPGMDCESAVCNLTAGWMNNTNGVVDQIDWQTFFSNTPTTGTGPSNDFNIGTSAGKYLYLEASSCFNRTGMVLSPCFDLSGTVLPVLSFAYHMNGATIADLHIDIIADGQLFESVWSRSGSQGNQWRVDTINLVAFTGQVVAVRFRGNTGSSWTSDIAIDAIAVIDLQAPPSANFTEDATTNCEGMAIQFGDASLNPVLSWEWQFDPPTINFVNGTNANSQHPVVQFNAAGDYDVTLIASNPFGSDTITKLAHIAIGVGATIPFYENFESNNSCSTAGNCGNTTCALTNGWVNVTNGAADDIDWRVDANGTPTNNTGPSLDHNPGTSGGYYLYLEASNSCTNRRADLISPCIDLTNVTAPRLSYWYHLWGQDMGALHVDILSGANWDLDVTTTKSGNLGNLWRVDTIDLSNYIGSSIKIRFRGITGTGARSDMAIDDIGIFEFGAPAAAFSYTGTQCIDSPIVLIDNSVGAVQTYSWDFGTGATPATANTQGPHVVTYSSSGNKTVNLTVSNALGTGTINQVVNVKARPSASFNYVNNVVGVVFSQASTGATSYFWDFGDGDSSDLPEPAHFYAGGGTYMVTLIAHNECGSDTTIQTVIVEGSEVWVVDPGIITFEIIPNPNDGSFVVRMPYGLRSDARLDVLDVSGRLIYSAVADRKVAEFPVSLIEAPGGVYVVRLSSSEGTTSRRIVVE